MKFYHIIFAFISFANCMPIENGTATQLNEKSEPSKKRVVRNAVTDPNMLWPNGLVYYQFEGYGKFTCEI